MPAVFAASITRVPGRACSGWPSIVSFTRSAIQTCLPAKNPWSEPLACHAGVRAGICVEERRQERRRGRPGGPLHGRNRRRSRQNGRAVILSSYFGDTTLGSFEQPAGVPKWLGADSTTHNISIVAKAPAGVAPDPQRSEQARDTI